MRYALPTWLCSRSSPEALLLSSARGTGGGGGGGEEKGEHGQVHDFICHEKQPMSFSFAGGSTPILTGFIVGGGLGATKQVQRERREREEGRERDRESFDVSGARVAQIILLLGQEKLFWFTWKC